MDNQISRFPTILSEKSSTALTSRPSTQDRKITYSHLRKFFEQMYNNVLVVQLPEDRKVPAVHPGLKDYIMAHNTGSLNVRSYDGKLSSEIYEQYMTAWRISTLCLME